MWPKVLRKVIPALITLTLMSTAWPDAVRATDDFAASTGLGGGPYRPGYSVVAVGLGYRHFGYSLDDSYDHPYGYGEYAEYGPWASRRFGGGDCRLAQRRVQTADGPRWRTIRICN